MHIWYQLEQSVHLLDRFHPVNIIHHTLAKSKPILKREVPARTQRLRGESLLCRSAITRKSANATGGRRDNLREQTRDDVVRGRVRIRLWNVGVRKNTLEAR